MFTRKTLTPSEIDYTPIVGYFDSSVFHVDPATLLRAQHPKTMLLTLTLPLV